MSYTQLRDCCECAKPERVLAAENRALQLRHKRVQWSVTRPQWRYRDRFGNMSAIPGFYTATLQHEGTGRAAPADAPAREVMAPRQEKQPQQQQQQEEAEWQRPIRPKAEATAPTATREQLLAQLPVAEPVLPYALPYALPAYIPAYAPGGLVFEPAQSAVPTAAYNAAPGIEGDGALPGTLPESAEGQPQRSDETTALYCSRCGTKQNDEEPRFCFRCGATIKR